MFDWRESTTFMAILDEGQELHAKAAILRQGKKRLGGLGEANLERLSAITDIGRLDRILDRVPDATSWSDLLNTP